MTSRGKNLRVYTPGQVPETVGPEFLPWLAREFANIAKIVNAPSYGTVAVPGQFELNARIETDKLTLVAGANVSIATDPANNRVIISASGSGEPPVTDGDKGDITVSGAGEVWTINFGAVSYAKMQDVSGPDKILGRVTAGAGDVQEITCTAAGRALLDDANNTAQRNTLGLGTAATTAASDYAPAAKGVTNGDLHAHTDGDGAQIAYSSLSGKPSSFPPSHHASSHNAGGGDALAIDAAAATGSLRTLGTAATAAAAGNHAHAGVYEPVQTPATQAEMEAGTQAAIRSMSPLRVAQAIAAQAGSGGTAWDGDIADINLDGGPDIGAALADADLMLVDHGANGTNRKSALSRVWTYISAKIAAGITPLLLGYTQQGKGSAQTTTDHYAGSTLTIPLNGGIYDFDFPANNITIAFGTPPTAPKCADTVLILKQRASGTMYGIAAWPAGIKWPGGVAQTMPQTLSARMRVVVSVSPSGVYDVSAMWMGV